MTQLLQLHHVIEEYKKHVAIDDVTLNLPAGKIVGPLGSNGSGKTTLIKLMSRLLYPTAGDIVIDGYRPPTETKKIVSYLPGTSYLRENVKTKDALTLFEDLYNDFSREKAEHLLEDLDLNPDEQLKNLSKGNKEKVQFILVMSCQAKLYILNEPIDGADPAIREYTLRTIINNYYEDVSAAISTHLIAETESILDETVFLKEGKVILQGNTDDIREEYGKLIDSLFREKYKV